MINKLVLRFVNESQITTHDNLSARDYEYSKNMFESQNTIANSGLLLGGLLDKKKI